MLLDYYSGATKHNSMIDCSFLRFAT